MGNFPSSGGILSPVSLSVSHRKWVTERSELVVPFKTGAQSTKWALMSSGESTFGILKDSDRRCSSKEFGALNLIGSFVGVAEGGSRIWRGNTGGWRKRDKAFLQCLSNVLFWMLTSFCCVCFKQHLLQTSEYCDINCWNCWMRSYLDRVIVILTGLCRWWLEWESLVSQFITGVCPGFMHYITHKKPQKEAIIEWGAHFGVRHQRHFVFLHTLIEVTDPIKLCSPNWSIMW